MPNLVKPSQHLEIISSILLLRLILLCGIFDTNLDGNQISRRIEFEDCVSSQEVYPP